MTKTAAAPTPAAAVEDRAQRKTMVGVVVSDKMDKTRTVRVTRTVRHPFYLKVMTKSSKFHVHDENNQSREGDVIEIASTRPISKLKRWRLVRVVKAAPRAAWSLTRPMPLAGNPASSAPKCHSPTSTGFPVTATSCSWIESGTSCL